MRSNIRKNLSFIIVLHHALRYQQKKVHDHAEFTDSAAEKRARDQDFNAFAVAWLRMHSQDGNPTGPLHAAAENTWMAISAEAPCLKNVLQNEKVANVPLAFCVGAALDVTYALWSKCVETNTQYRDGQTVSVTDDRPGRQSKTPTRSSNGRGRIWQWTVD